MTREYTPENITELKDNEVFVFGSNASGFHGAGASGLAFSGTPKNIWRTSPTFQAALNSPKGSILRKGKWAILGQARGYQEGLEGKSYAIETIKRPGLKRSTSLTEIEEQLLILKEFSIKNNHLKFYITKIGCALAGYTVSEISNIFKNIVFPENVILPIEFENRN